MSEPLDQMQQEAHGDQKYVRMASLFKSVGTGVELKEEAMQKVLSSESAQQYKFRLQHALLSFKVGDRFTVEQLTAIVGRPPKGTHFNTVGAIINGMTTRGLIRKTGRMVQAQRVKMHATELAEWELVKYR